MLGEFYFKNEFLTPDECQMFIDHYNENEAEAYRSKFRHPPYAEINLTMRISKAVDVDKKTEKFAPIIKRVYDTVKSVNEEIFLFDVDWDYTMEQKRSAHIIKYDGAEKGFWGRHHHVNWISNNKQFKLYASIVLSSHKEYEGGDNIYFFGAHTDRPTPVEHRKQGIFTLYPAFRGAQINPVLTGNKYTLDFLFQGPYWR